jgi:hypothetical protein
MLGATVKGLIAMANWRQDLSFLPTFHISI